ncbi:MAG: tryptophan synthase subunit alpha [Desulfuromonadaceae bacterium]|nr:tryptophan synthase subunit alpha [Desulfuromonadaceae bacterium]
MGRIEQTFLKLKQQRETALIPFVTAGDPDAAKTAAILETLDRAGADLIELGMPFSDPMADGPTIQAASERALAGGMTLAKVLDLVAAFRRSSQTPIVLMGYYNPVFRFGLEAFARRAAQAGVDALLLVDVPPEERAELYEYFDAQELDLITLLAPTTPAERAAELLRQARGFVYYVSMTGVTGTTQVDTTAIADQVRQLRIQSPVPVAVGFGIATAEDAEKIAAMADAVVVGSALVKIIAQHAESAALLDEVYAFVHDLKQGVRRAQPDK